MISRQFIGGVEKFITSITAEKEWYDQNCCEKLNQGILDQSLPEREYATIDELREAYGKYLTNKKTTLKLNNVNIIDTKEGLHAYIKEELEHRNGVNNIRFYRGHYEAEWNCQSTLLRAFHDYYKHQQDASICTDKTIKHLNDFINNHYILWEKLLISDNVKETFLETFRNMEDVINVKGMIDKYLGAAQDYVKYLSDKSSLNAITIELAAQHYGLPTSLVDFTSCLCVALYFAINGKEKQKDKKEINDYLAIIHFDTEGKVVNLEKAIGMSYDLFENGIQSNNMRSQFKKDRATWNKKDDSRLVSEITKMCYISPTQWRSIENDRLMKQRGVLLCLSKNYHCSVEQVCKYGFHLDMPTLNCTLINKSLIPDIKNFLGDRVTKEKLGLI